MGACKYVLRVRHTVIKHQSPFYSSEGSIFTSITYPFEVIITTNRSSQRAKTYRFGLLWRPPVPCQGLLGNYASLQCDSKKDWRILDTNDIESCSLCLWHPQSGHDTLSHLRQMFWQRRRKAVDERAKAALTASWKAKWFRSSLSLWPWAKHRGGWIWIMAFRQVPLLYFSMSFKEIKKL